MKKNNLYYLVTAVVLALGSYVAGTQNTSDEKVLAAPQTQQIDTSNLEVYFSPKGGCTAAIIREIDNAQRDIKMQAYSFTSYDIAKALINAKNRGVKVLLLMDDLNRSDKNSKMHQMHQAGITIYLDGAESLAHNKVIIVDDQTVVTGSFNFTNAAENRNAENVVIIKNTPKINERYQQNFSHLQEEATLLH